MQIKSLHKAFVLLAFLCGTCMRLFAQNTANTMHFSGGDVFGTRAFIENKGQFSTKVNSSPDIIYGYEHNLEHIYFSKSGYSYDLIKPYQFNERDLERLERGKEPRKNADKHKQINVQWIGASLNTIELLADRKQTHYFTYGAASMNAAVYKTLLYKNVYPHTDIEFTIPENKESGLKYTIHLHPGADVSKIKLLYSGQTKHPKLTKSGALYIECGAIDITEQVPVSFYKDGGAVASNFVLRGDTVMFALETGKDITKDISIDPYIATTSNFTVSNFVFDIDYDYAGNSFIFGSRAPAKVAMYNSAGQLQWTFGGTIPAIGWSSQPAGANDYIGNFVVDKFSGKAYVSFALPYPKVVRLTLQGNYDNFVTAPNNLFQELWEMSFHCSSGNILLLGGGHTSNLSSAQINPNTASVTLSTFNPTNTGFVHDMSAFTQDAVGTSFAYFATSNTLLDNHITKVNNTYNGNVWTVASGYNVLAEADNKSVYTGNSVTSAGYNALCANTNYLFYYDGYNLAAYSKSTGTLVGSTILTGALPKANGGIAVDDCNNVYVGRTGGIACLKFNGTQFTAQSTATFTFPYSTSNTFDVKYNAATNQLYFAGSNFCGSMTAPNSATCAPNFGNCVFSQQLQMSISSSLTCSAPGSATAIVNSPQGTYSFLWLPLNVTGSVVTNITPGIYTVVATNLLTNQSYSVSSLLTASGIFSANLVTTLGNPCGTSTNNTMAVSGVTGGSGQYSYTWLSAGTGYTTQSVANVPIGNYTLFVNDLVSNCAYIKSFTLSNPAQLSAGIASGIFQTCVNNTVYAYASAIGGSPSYAYQWSNGTSGLMTGLTSSLSGQQVFTLTVTDSLGCTASASITLFFQASQSVTVSNATVCPNSIATITCSGAPTYSWNGVAGNYIYTLMPQQTTTLEFSTTFSLCVSKTTSTITVLPGPTLSISGSTDICFGKPISITATGANLLVWSGPSSNQIVGPSITYSASNFSHSGFYLLNGTLSNGCSKSQTLLITVHPNPTLSASGGTFCTTQTATLNAISSSALLFQWYGPSGFSAQGSNPAILAPTLSNMGSYSVVASSAYGCTASAVTNVSITSPPSFTISASSPVCQYQTISLLNSALPANSSMNWQGPNGFSSSASNPSISNCGLPDAGIYTLSVDYGPCHTSSLIAVMVYPSPQFIAKSTGTLCTADSLQLSAIAGNDQNIQSYLWTGPLGFTSNQASTLILNATPANGGNYTITTVNNLGCAHSSVITVPVYPVPHVTTISDTACLNAPALLIALGAPSYTWYNGATALGNGPYLNFTNASPLQLNTFTVIGSSVEGCTNSALAHLLVLPNPTVTVNTEQRKVCMYADFTLTANGAEQYTWLGGNINGLSGNMQSCTANYQAGVAEFSVRGANKFGCTALATTSVLILALPQASIVGGPFEACVPFCGTYSIATSSELKSLQWSFDDGIHADNKQTHCFDKAGKVLASIYFSDENNCANSSTATILAAAKPKAQFKISNEQPQAMIDEVQLIDMSQGNVLQTWNWSLLESSEGVTQVYSGKQPEKLRYEKAGLVVVALEVITDAGCRDTLVRSFNVHEPFLVYVPNAFTPNTDKSNDVFAPVMSGVVEFTFQIFDRWGELIFESSEPNQGWNGSFKGSPCKQDEYIWKLKVKGNNGQQKELLGSVLLYR